MDAASFCPNQANFSRNVLKSSQTKRENQMMESNSGSGVGPRMDNALKQFVSKKLQTIMAKEWLDYNGVDKISAANDHVITLYTCANLCPSFESFSSNRENELTKILEQKSAIRPRIFCGAKRPANAIPEPPQPAPFPKREDAKELNRLLNSLFPNEKTSKSKGGESNNAKRSKTSEHSHKARHSKKHNEASTVEVPLVNSTCIEDRVNQLAYESKMIESSFPSNNGHLKMKIKTVNGVSNLSKDISENNTSLVTKNHKKLEIEEIISDHCQSNLVVKKGERHKLEDETSELISEMIEKFKIKKCSVILKRIDTDEYFTSRQCHNTIDVSKDSEESTENDCFTNEQVSSKDPFEPMVCIPSTKNKLILKILNAAPKKQITQEETKMEIKCSLRIDPILQVLPSNCKTLPSNDKTLPSNDKTLPSYDKTLPSNDKTLPSNYKTSYEPLSSKLQPEAEKKSMECISQFASKAKHKAMKMVQKNIEEGNCRTTTTNLIDRIKDKLCEALDSNGNDVLVKNTNFRQPVPPVFVEDSNRIGFYKENYEDIVCQANDDKSTKKDQEKECPPIKTLPLQEVCRNISMDSPEDSILIPLKDCSLKRSSTYGVKDVFKRPRLELNLKDMKFEHCKPWPEYYCAFCKTRFDTKRDWILHYDSDLPKCSPSTKMPWDKMQGVTTKS